MIRSHAIVGAVSAALGVAGTLYLRPPRVEVRTETRVVTVRETKRVKVRETRKPDGTVVTERTDTSTHGTTNESGRTLTLPAPAPRWSASVLAGATLSLAPVYGGQVQYRLLGPVTVGVWGMGGGVVAGGVSAGLTW